MDGIQLEIMWSNMISIVSDQAKALKRTAFSPIVREAGDLATALFDAQGRMVAQARNQVSGFQDWESGVGCGGRRLGCLIRFVRLSESVLGLCLQHG